MDWQFLLCLVATVLILVAAFGVQTARISLAWLGVALFVFAIGCLPSIT